MPSRVGRMVDPDEEEARKLREAEIENERQRAIQARIDDANAVTARTLEVVLKEMQVIGCLLHASSSSSSLLQLQLLLRFHSVL
jgi:hypothetical protein